VKKKKTILIRVGIVFVLIVTISLAYLFYRDVRSKIEKKIVSSDKRVKRHVTITSAGKKSHPSIREHKIAIIIDDIGYELSPINEILKINAPITVSILPHCPYSEEAAERAYRAGKEILLHLPMEPREYPDKNPGDKALFICMSDKKIRRRLEENLKGVPHASGVNNHMGSRFMADEKKLEVVLRVLRDKNLFFIDSYTSRDTKGKKVARKIGLKFAGRDIFIDNKCNYTDTLKIIAKAIGKRDKWRTLIIIGHPYESTIMAIKKAIPMLKAKGIKIVPPSDLTG